MSKKFALAVALLAVLASAHIDLASAADIAVPASDASRYAIPGTVGLNASIYQNTASPADAISGSITLSDVQGYEASNPHPVATYVMSLGSGTAVTYNNNYGDTTATNSFLSSDASSLVPTAYSGAIHTSVFDGVGYISVTAPGLYTFSTNSDDASFLLIDHQLVVDNPGSHGPASQSGTVTFAAAGIYPAELIYVNQDYNGSTGGASFSYSNPAGATFVQFSTPEPSTFVLGGLGLVGLLDAARRRRKA